MSSTPYVISTPTSQQQQQHHQHEKDTAYDVDYDKRIENKKWIPIESDAEILTSYIHELGVPSNYTFVEILGLEPDLLQCSLPSPTSTVLAVLLLFPYTANFKRKRYKQHQHLSAHPVPSNPHIYFLPQVVSNACGTIAVIHAVLNNSELFINDGVHSTPSHTDTRQSRNTNGESSWFQKFYHNTHLLPLHERAVYFSNDHMIESIHHKYAVQGQTNAADSMNVDVHYNAWIRVPVNDGDDKQYHLYELDGTKKQPLDHGATQVDTFLYDVARKIREEFMGNDPTEVRYSVLALVKEE